MLLAVLLAASALLLHARGAAALEIYGTPRPLPGAGGCLNGAPAQSPTGQPCPGVAAGLAGAQAVAVSPNDANVYVAGADDVVALARNGASGALRSALSPSARSCVGASPCATRDPALDGADALALSPDGRFVYVGAANSATVSAFLREPDGVLAPLAGTLPGPDQAAPYFGCVSGVPLAGAPRSGCEAQLPALNGVAALAVSPDGRDLYVLSYGLHPGSDSVVTLQRNPRDGGLRPLQGRGGCVQSLPGHGCRALAGLEGASAIAISQDGRFVYTASELSGAVRGFLRDVRTGALAPMFGRGGCVSSGARAVSDKPCAVTVPQLAGARSIAISPDGRQLYVAAFDPGAVVALLRDPATGAFAPLPPACLQAEPDASCRVGLPFLHGAAAVALAPGGGAVYVISEGGNSLVELLRNPADGSLSLASASPTAEDPLSGPVALALAPSGGEIYLASPFDDGLAALTG